MVLNSDTKVFGVPSTNEVSLRSGSKVQKYYGLIFPLGSNVNSGYFSKSSGVELIKRNLLQLLRTKRNERFMLPDFGTNLKRYLFEPIDEFLFSKIRSEISKTIINYAPYVNLIDINITATDRNQFRAGIYINLICSVKDEDTVVFEIKLGL